MRIKGRAKIRANQRALEKSKAPTSLVIQGFREHTSETYKPRFDMIDLFLLISLWKNKKNFSPLFQPTFQFPKHFYHSSPYFITSPDKSTLQTKPSIEKNT